MRAQTRNCLYVHSYYILRERRATQVKGKKPLSPPSFPSLLCLVPLCAHFQLHLQRRPPLRAVHYCTFFLPTFFIKTNQIFNVSCVVSLHTIMKCCCLLHEQYMNIDIHIQYQQLFLYLV